MAGRIQFFTLSFTPSHHFADAAAHGHTHLHHAAGHHANGHYSEGAETQVMERGVGHS